MMKKNDTHYPIEAPDDDTRPPPNDPDLARQKALAEEIMRDDSEVLKELAK